MALGSVTLPISNQLCPIRMRVRIIRGTHPFFHQGQRQKSFAQKGTVGLPGILRLGMFIIPESKCCPETQLFALPRSLDDANRNSSAAWSLDGKHAVFSYSTECLDLLLKCVHIVCFLSPFQRGGLLKQCIIILSKTDC